jgi:hypothetical protein
MQLRLIRDARISKLFNNNNHLDVVGRLKKSDDN